jgi:hypothetical protein
MRLAIALSAVALFIAGWTSPAPAPTAGATASDQELLVGRPWLDLEQLENDGRLTVYIFADQPLEKDLVGIFFHAHKYLSNSEVFEYRASDKRMRFHFPTGDERCESAYVLKHEKNGDFDLSLRLATDPGRKGAAKKYWSRVEWEQSKTLAPMLTMYRQLLHR